MPNQHDNAVEKVLAALKTAAPPEGMEARIAERLAQQPAPMPSPITALGWELAGSTPAAAWWRGALSGAAFATLSAFALLLIQHRSRIPAAQDQTAVHNQATSGAGTSPHAVPTGQSRAIPCPHPTILRVDNDLPAPTPEVVRGETYAETTAPSRPAPALPLTAEERSLARLARTADPRELATLNPETQARLEEEDRAAFTKFFTPPPPPPPPTPEVTPQAAEANSEASPQINPEAGPDDNHQPSPQSPSPETVPPADQ